MIDTINSIGSHFIMQENSSNIFPFALLSAVLLIIIRWVVCNLMSLLWSSWLLLLCLLAYFLYIGWVKVNEWVNHLRQLKGANLWKVLALCVRGACVLSTVVNTLFSCLGTTFFSRMARYGALSTKSKGRSRSQKIQTTQDTLQCTDPNRCRTPMQRYNALYLLRGKPNLTETEQKWFSEYENDPKFEKGKYIGDLKNKKEERKI